MVKCDADTLVCPDDPKKEEPKQEETIKEPITDVVDYR
jgi:hypothetical protein